MRHIFTFVAYAIVVVALTGCENDSGNPAGAGDPNYIGTWKTSISLFGSTTELSYTINKDNTCLSQSITDGVVDEKSTGTWTATATTITLTFIQCQADTTWSGTLSDVPCDDPTTTENEAVRELPLSTINGNTWTIPFGETGSWPFTKQ